MREQRLNAFADASIIEDGWKLGIARHLERSWADVVVEPIPEDLQRLVDRLEERIRRRSRHVGRTVD